MSSTFTSDTNIFIYAADSSEGAKHVLSDYIVERMVLSRSPTPMQCLSEFYALTIRKGRLSPAGAQAVVDRLLFSLHVIPAAPEDVVQAMRINQQHSIPFYDALLLATAIRAGCTVFLTEDLQHRRTIDGMTILNPFKLPAVELDQLMA